MGRSSRLKVDVGLPPPARAVCPPRVFARWGVFGESGLHRSPCHIELPVLSMGVAGPASTKVRRVTQPGTEGWWRVARHHVIMSKGVQARWNCPPCFQHRTHAFCGVWEWVPFNSRWLTQRAADGGYAPRFSSLFAALGFVRFDGLSTLPPTAANAPRWAVIFKNENRFAEE